VGVGEGIWQYLSRDSYCRLSSPLIPPKTDANGSPLAHRTVFALLTEAGGLRLPLLVLPDPSTGVHLKMPVNVTATTDGAGVARFQSLGFQVPYEVGCVSCMPQSDDSPGHKGFQCPEAGTRAVAGHRSVAMLTLREPCLRACRLLGGLVSCACCSRATVCSRRTHMRST
jgi:hypothetical protein